MLQCSNLIIHFPKPLDQFYWNYLKSIGKSIEVELCLCYIVGKLAQEK